MKIYFAGSIRAGRGDQDIYAQIIDELKKYGQVLTEHIGTIELSDQGEAAKKSEDTFIFSRDMDWVRESDLVVAEVTTPSLGVGYELGQAEAMEKRVLCLYRPSEDKRLSTMLVGNPYFKIVTYQNIEEVAGILQKELS